MHPFPPRLVGAARLPAAGAGALSDPLRREQPDMRGAGAAPLKRKDINGWRHDGAPASID